MRLDPDKAITQLVHDAWGTRQGLPDRRVAAIAQTADGYLWIGTGSGLARFDGIAFTVFRSASVPEIGNDDIRALQVDGTGALWIGTYGGGLTRLQNGKFTRFTTADGLAHDTVYRISRGRGDVLWIGTGGGVSRLEAGAFTNFSTADGLDSNVVFPVLEDREGAVWVGTYGGGLSRYQDGEFTTFRAADGLGSDLILDLLEDPDGSLWVSTYGGGLVRYRDGVFSRFVGENGAGHDRPFMLLRDRSASLWIGNYDGGLSRLHEGRYAHFNRRQGLSDNLVLALFQDREGSLWVGTTGGLDRLRNGKLTHYSTAEGLSHDRVYAVYEQQAGTLWIATEGGGLNRLRDGQVSVFTAADGLASDNVVSLAGDRAGDLWIGTVGQGVSVRRGGRFINHGVAQGIQGLIYALAEGPDGAMWVGGSAGLGRLRDGQFTPLDKDDGLPAEAVRAMLQDRDDGLWIGSNGGGLSLLRQGGFTTWTGADGLGGNFVYALHQDDDGVLWIGTKDGGLSRFKQGRLFAFAGRGGMDNTAVYQILEHDGALWLSSPNRLLRVDKRQLDAVAAGSGALVETTVLDQAAGLRGGFNGGSQPAGWKAADGRLWFASDAGLVVVDPDSIPVNGLIPPVHIEWLLVDGRRVDGNAGAPANGIELPPGRGNLEIHYTALSLVAPDQVRFRYRLEGFDAGWIEAGTRRVAYYTNVPPGRYRFQVLASNNDGLWNQEGAVIAFHLTPAFHRTWWFAVLAGLAALLAVLALHGLNTRQLRRRSQALAGIVTERTRELAAANAALRRLSTLDALTGISNRRGFDQKFEEEWARARRHGWPLSAAMIDIDHFKPFNDGYGHQQGDDCLRQVADALRQGTARSGDHVARYGGEEFLVLLPNTGPEGAVAVAERLRRAIEALAIPHEFAGDTRHVTVSAGVGTALPGQDRIPGELIARADAALYEAKRSGRNQVAVVPENPLA